MVSRLVLGWGSTGRAIVEFVADERKHFRVITDDPELITSLRDENILATQNDPKSPSALREVTEPVDVVLVASDSATRNCKITASARAAFPGAILIVFSGVDSTDEQRDVLSTMADTVIDYLALLSDTVLDVATSPAAVRAHALRSVLTSIDGKLAIFMHDNPDPDAIASAIGLAHIANELGIDTEVCHFGEISHQANRAFVNLLAFELTQLDHDDELPEVSGIALVDHSVPGINDQLPEGTDIDIIIDHHTPAGPVTASFTDLRESVGATSSIIIEYLQQLGIEPDEALATALLYGIQTDTRDFTRKITPLDFESAGFVLDRADTAVLVRVENPSVSAETLRTIASAITEREVHGSVLATCVGQIREHDALGQAADLLLKMDGITTTLVYGFSDQTIYASARTSGVRTPMNLGEVMRDAFGQIGNAGGHAEMAGAQIPLGFLGAVDPDSKERLNDIVSAVMNDRFFQIMTDHAPEIVAKQSEQSDLS